MSHWEGSRKASDGTEIFLRRSSPEGETKAVVCFVHGVCEHSGRYARIADALTSAGYEFSAFDLRGHGRSGGKRGDARLEPTKDDVAELIRAARERPTTSRKVFLYGQSLGGLVALAYTLDRDPRPDGVIASAPVLHTALRRQRAKVLVARTLGRLVPSLGMKPGLDPQKLMRDDDVLADRAKDPLVIDRVTAGLARDVLRATDHVLANAARFPVPLLLLHGTADEINLLTGSEEMHASAASGGADVTLKVYEGVKHHPHNDPERTRVFADVVAWLDRHL